MSGGRSLGSPYIGGGNGARTAVGPCTVRSNALWVMD